jgi:hypothetical protein
MRLTDFLLCGTSSREYEISYALHIAGANADYASFFALRVSSWRESPAAWLCSWSLGIVYLMSATASIKKQAVLRFFCIIGACVCFVHGLRFIYEDFSYHLPLGEALVVTTIPFVPIFAVAPRYRNGSKIYTIILLVELAVIAMAPFIVVR